MGPRYAELTLCKEVTDLHEHRTEPHKRNRSPALKMEGRLLLLIVLFQHSVAAGNSDHRISIFAHEMDDVILPLSEHSLHQVDFVIWKKGEQPIATYSGNGSVHFVDLGYGVILNISNDGSLILKAQSWKDGEEYSAHITLNNNSQSAIHYCVKVHNIKFIPHDMGPKMVNAKVGEELILPWEADIDKSKIEEIDWLTDRWNYFAVTKVGGDIRILEDDYAECLASSPNGSLIFKRVTKSHQGNYRACIFSQNGIIVERNYQVHIYDQAHEEQYADYEHGQQSADRPSENTVSMHHTLYPFILGSLGTIIIICSIILIFLLLLRRKVREDKRSSFQGKKHKPALSPEQVKMCPQAENHETKKGHDTCV